MLTKEILEKLAAPFPAGEVSWKPGATTKDKTRAMALAYVDPRAYMDRLNEVVGGDWSDTYTVQNDGQIVVCHLTILGSTRADVGEDDSTGDHDSGPKNKATTSAAQAFKRACVKFGLGAYLYRLPRTWAEYDPVKKQFTDAALATLARQVGGQAPKKAPTKKAVPPAGTGDATPAFPFNVEIPAGDYKGKTLGWLADNDPDYLRFVAESAKDESIKSAAQVVLKTMTEG
jgi:hypothetical protein